nr:hypothetical protein [Tanacetum cinerariifolium]GEX82887.1 hypothetical protein [Tanacetum cinerariifolium]
MKKKACYNCGGIDHLSYDCGEWVKMERSCPKNNNTHKSMQPRPAIHRVDKFLTVDLKFSTAAKRVKTAAPRPNMNSTRPQTTQDLMIILIQRVQRLERELKVRTLIHNVDRGRSKSVMTWEGKQHKASCKSKLVNSVTKPLHILPMDLFGPTSVSSISHKWYCLVVTDDFSRCDNRGEFRNKEMNDFCSQKGIKREFSNARTPQQNGVAKRRNRTLIEAARTMVLVNKSQNKTPYDLFNGRTYTIGFLKSFGCHVMILNTLDNLGKFKAKWDEGYFIGYFMSRKAFRVFNKRTKRLEENLHVEFLENKAIEKGVGPNWLFNIDSLTKSIDYVPVDACTNSTNLSVPTAYFTDSQEPSSDTRLISKRVANQVETPSLDNILTLTNMFEDILGVTTNSVDSDGVEADVSNKEPTITSSPTPILRIHKDHLKSQIIGPVDTPIQTRNKSKEVGEQSFIAIIHQKTDPALLQFCLFSCEGYVISTNTQEIGWSNQTKNEKERSKEIRVI